MDSIKYDMGLVLQNTEPASAVVFNTERESSALRQAVTDGLGKGWTRVLDNEDTIAYGAAWKPSATPIAFLLAKDDPSMAHVSPNRYLDTALLNNQGLPGVDIAMKGTHLVSEANCIHTKVRGRAWREKTWHIQVSDVLNDVARDHAAGKPVVLAGDFNTGIYFNGAKLFALLQQQFGDYAVHVHNGGLDHIFLVSTDKVKLSEVGTEIVTDNKSDHNMVTATIRAELLS